MLYIKCKEGWRPLWSSFKVCDNANLDLGCYQNTTLEEMRNELDARRDRFIEANNIQNIADKQRYFRGHHFIEPLFGAFGEKL